jgi:hypothetical protein
MHAALRARIPLQVATTEALEQIVELERAKREIETDADLPGEHRRG